MTRTEAGRMRGCENHGERLFDIGALAALTDAAYQSLDPVRWPLPASVTQESGRLFGDGRFATLRLREQAARRTGRRGPVPSKRKKL